MTLARKSGTVVDNAGNIITNAKIEVRRETPGAPLAAIKSDREGLSALTNPFNAEADGSFAFHAVGGAYKVRAYVGASGAPSFEKILRYEPVGLLQEYDLDAVLLGKRQQVRVATTANITIATALNSGDTLDGVTLATSDLVLVKDQTAKAENGVYVVGVSPARSAEFDTYNEHAGAMVAVVEGTAGAGSVWFCTANAGGILDTTAIDFTELAATAGPPGADGEPGPPGPATIAIGTVTTVAAGEDATVTNSGDDENVILDFEIPEGEQGDVGPANSLSIGTVTGGVSADATITGTAPTQTLNLVLPQGDPGSDGDDGAAATITIGAVTTVAPGDPATVTNVGTTGAAILDFEIPQGDPGADGAGVGDVVGPASAADSRLAAFDGTTGKLLKDSGVTTASFATASQGTKADSAVQSVVAGTNITVDNTDPRNPVVAAAGGGGSVTSITAGTGLSGGAITTSGTVSLDVGSLTADTSPDSTADYLATYDTSAAAHKKVLPKYLRPDALSTSSGSAPSFAARAWGHFTGAGSATLLAGGNIASVSRTGAGTYTVTFTTAMPDANYAVTVSANRDSTSSNSFDVTPKSLSTTSFVVVTASTTAGAAADAADIHFAVFR